MPGATAASASPLEAYKLALCPNTGTLLVDHTLLGNADTEAQIEKLVSEAIGSQPNSVAICIYPRFIPFAKECLKKQNNSSLLVATVVNFPLGRDPIQKVLKETKEAVANGADEIDLVIDYALIKRNKEHGVKAAENLVRAVRQVCPEGKVSLKVIIETGELQTDELIIAASMAALKGGCDFLKTSTGKVPVNATLESTKIMLHCIAAYQTLHPERDVGFKPAGGVRTCDVAGEYLLAAESIMGTGWVNHQHFRFGSSSLLGTLRQNIKA